MSEGGSGDGGGSHRSSHFNRVFGWSPLRQSTLSSPSIQSMASSAPRILRDDLQQVIMGLGPLIERTPVNPQSLPTWLQQQRNRDINGQAAELPSTSGQNTGTFVINMDGEPPATVTEPTGSSQQSRHNLSHHNSGVQAGTSNTSTTDGDDLLRNSPELRALLSFADKYVSFILILLLKLAFDHRIGLLVIIGLFITFCHANAVIKREVTKQGKRQLSSLVIVATNLVTCICFVYFVLAEKGLAYALILIPPYSEPIGGWETLWIIAVTDFVLKLITILIKGVIVALPGAVLAFPRRGKYYLFVETSSQVYRSIAPMQHWLYYFSESYSGTSKVFGVLLSATYLLCKCRDIVSKTRAWKRSLIQVLQRVNYGVTPTTDQLKAAGESCPICQDEYKRATLLTCSHIFCEECVSVWFDRERTCPMCRAQIADDPTWRDGSTSLLVQLF